MMIIPRCLTEYLTVLLITRTDGIIHALETGEHPPSWSWATVPLDGAEKQIYQKLAERTGYEGNLKVHANFTAALTITAGPSTLFLAELEPPVPDTTWVSLPQLLRTMPADRLRLPYLKAMQHLAGGL